MAIQQDLSLWQYTRAEMLSNFKIYSFARDMLLAHRVPVPSSVEGINLLMVRTMNVLWPQPDFIQQRQEAYQRYLLNKEGKITTTAGGPAQRQLQTPGRINRRLDDEFNGQRQGNEPITASILT